MPPHPTPAPSVQVMDGCTSSTVFDKQHEQLTQRRQFNHSLNGVLLCKAEEPLSDQMNTSHRIRASKDGDDDDDGDDDGNDDDGDNDDGDNDDDDDDVLHSVAKIVQNIKTFNPFL